MYLENGTVFGVNLENCTVYCVLNTVYCVYLENCNVYWVLCTEYYVLRVLCTVYCVLVLCTVCTTRIILFTVYCVLHVRVISYGYNLPPPLRKVLKFFTVFADFLTVIWALKQVWQRGAFINVLWGDFFLIITNIGTFSELFSEFD